MTKGDERCEKEENEQEEEAGRHRPANQTLLDFPPSPFPYIPRRQGRLDVVVAPRAD